MWAISEIALARTVFSCLPEVCVARYTCIAVLVLFLSGSDVYLLLKIVQKVCSYTSLKRECSNNGFALPYNFRYTYFSKKNILV